MEKHCMSCQTTITRLDNRNNPQWYKTYDEVGSVIGYRCASCYDRIRRYTGFKDALKRRVCSNCGSNETLVTATKKGYPHHRWYGNGKGGWWCNKCHHVISFTPVVRRKWNEKRMHFKPKRVTITLPENPRKGICEWCHKKIGDEYVNANGKKAIIKRTTIHHKEYDESDPLKHTIELCASCHRKETIRLSKI